MLIIRILLLAFGIVFALAGTIMVVTDINDAPYYHYNSISAKLTDSELCAFNEFILTTPRFDKCSYDIRSDILKNVRVVKLREYNLVYLDTPLLNSFETIPYFQPTLVENHERNLGVDIVQTALVAFGSIFIFIFFVVTFVR